MYARSLDMVVLRDKPTHRFYSGRSYLNGLPMKLLDISQGSLCLHAFLPCHLPCTASASSLATRTASSASLVLLCWAASCQHTCKYSVEVGAYNVQQGSALSTCKHQCSRGLQKGQAQFATLAFMQFCLRSQLKQFAKPGRFCCEVQQRRTD